MGAGRCRHDRAGPSLGTLAPRERGCVDAFDGCHDRPLGPERVELLGARRVLRILDDDETAGREEVVATVEDGADVGTEGAADAKQRELVHLAVGAGRVAERGVERALEEADALVEQVEAEERVAHEVEVGVEPGYAFARQARSGLRIGSRAEPVDDPHIAIRQLEPLDVRAQEHRSATASDTAVGEVAGYRLRSDRVQAAFEVLEASPTDRGVRQERRLRLFVGAGGARCERARSFGYCSLS